MGRVVKFKHFQHVNPVTLMENMQSWINGETEHVEWVNEFHVVYQNSKWHAFVKYTEEE